MGKTSNGNNRESWGSKWGFILACIGSAVGMGNIWLFPSRVANYGGAFLVAYLIFDILIGFSGVIGGHAPNGKTGGERRFQAGLRLPWKREYGCPGRRYPHGGGADAGHWLLRSGGLDF